MTSKTPRHKRHFRLSPTLTIIITLLLITALALTFFYTPLNTKYSTMVKKDVIVGFTGAPDLQLLTKYKATILEVYSIIPAIHALVPQKYIESLEKDPAIEYVSENSSIKINSTEEEQTSGQNWPQWPLQLIEAPAAWTKSNGTGIKIALLDTGITPIDDLPFYGGSNCVNSGDTTDLDGHGTMMASLIVTQHTSPTGLRGVAPGAEVYAVKVLNDQGEGSTTHAILGIQWAVDNGMHIISISFGFDNHNPSLNSAINRAYARGVLIVASAGNNGDTFWPDVVYPAKYDVVIAVSAINENKDRLRSASFGSEVELAAPGEKIWARGIGNTIVSGSGTSFAVPYVTGTAALVWGENNSLTNVEVRNILTQTATSLHGDGRDKYFGYGLINAAAALQIAPLNSNNNTSTSTSNPSGSTNTATPSTKINPQTTPTPPTITQTSPPTTFPTPTNTQTPPPTTLQTNTIIIIVSIPIILIFTVITTSIILYNKNKKQPN